MPVRHHKLRSRITKHDARVTVEDEGPASGLRLREVALEEGGGASGGEGGEAPEGEGAAPMRTGGFSDTRNDLEADGKYLLLAVPDFKPGMSTYLRLGAACSTWENALGGELEQMVHRAGTVGKTTELPFIDDERNRGAHPIHPGVGATLAESAILHTKGGWRDHSDGNRITTTYGDKIEIIRGSYKMIVLGRQDEPEPASGWDCSGQHIQDFGLTMPGACITVEFVPLYGGTWMQRNSIETINSWTRYAGNKKDEYWGDLKEDYTGQEVPMPKEVSTPVFGALAEEFARTNPDIIEKTFAKSITSQTGSVVLPIPTITESTWVAVSTGMTTADAITETTVVTGAITETTTAGSTSETSTIGAVTEMSTIGTQTATTLVGAVAETTLVGASVGTTLAGAIVETTIVGSNLELFVGAADNAVKVAAESMEIAVCGAKLGIDVAGLKLDATIAGLIADIKLAGLIADISLCKLKFECNLAPLKLEMDMAEKVHLRPIEFKIGSTQFEIAATHYKA